MPDEPKQWRYPAQRENYRENPALEDYEKMLGLSMLNFDIDDWLENTACAVLNPEQRAAFEAEWQERPMQEKMRDDPVPYLSTPGLRPDEVSISGDWGIAAVERALEAELQRQNPYVKVPRTALPSSPAKMERMLRELRRKREEAEQGARQEAERVARAAREMAEHGVQEGGDRLARAARKERKRAARLARQGRDGAARQSPPHPDPLPRRGEGAGADVARAAREQSGDAAPPPSPLSPTGGEGPGVRGASPSDENTASSPPYEGGAGGVAAEPKRRRTPRCSKRESRDREEAIAIWLLNGASTAAIARTSKVRWGINRRMTQLYIQRVKAKWADEAGAEDVQAHLWKSKLMRERLLQRGFKDLDKIEDPTKSATMLRTLDNLIKHNDATMEEIRHHRVVTRRDTSPDGKKARMLREKMIYMPFDELLERAENMRNRWFHEWNLLRLAEKEREGTLGPGYIESPYVAVLKDPKYKMEPTLGPPGSEYHI